MVSKVRKKSPRAPSISLDEAIERVLRAYEKDRLHPAPTEVFAQNIGYKSANNGAALSALASLRYYGLVERPSDGMLAVTKDVESYKFAPGEELKRSLLLSFVRTPPLYDELLDKYASGLPSDANLRYELIQRGFAPSAAESVLAAFRRSVDFAGCFSQDGIDSAPAMEGDIQSSPSAPQESAAQQSHTQPRASATLDRTEPSKSEDQIPVRLPGGRRAWLVIPIPFYASDKDRLKAQIDLLLTEEDNEYPD